MNALKTKEGWMGERKVQQSHQKPTASHNRCSHGALHCEPRPCLRACLSISTATMYPSTHLLLRYCVSHSLTTLVLALQSLPTR